MNKTLKKKEKTNSKGITLIALVITIIVLLILAGVTINLTLGENGIFKTAEMAGKNYTQAQEQELAGIANFENEINNIIAGTGNNEGGDQEETNHPMLKDVATPGAYVKYDTGIKTVGKEGIVTFRVLYNDETYGLQIISDKNIEQVTLGGETWETGRDSYNNAIATLNEKAEYYATSSPYALDGRCVGSVPTVGADGKFSAKNTENIGPAELGFSSTADGIDNMKDKDENYETDYNTLQILENSNFPGILGCDYWLASRRVSLFMAPAYFGMRTVNYDGTTGGYLSLCNVISDSQTEGELRVTGFRPVISLNSNVKVISGNGTSEGSAYEIDI